jgi:N-acetylneuraminate epimerase
MNRLEHAMGRLSGSRLRWSRLLPNPATGFAVFFLMSTLAGVSAGLSQFSRLPDLPDSEGFAGAFAGVAGGRLIVAGGANFPDKRPWENGKKVWYDTVFALERPDGQWKIIGKLPRPLGYGISVTTDEGIVCVGGSDAQKHYADVFLLTLKGGQLKTKGLPSLPVPVANGIGALLGQTLLVFGGSEQPGENSALNRLFAMDLSALAPQWRELEPCQGKARILPMAAVADGAFYVIGGAALEPENGKVGRVYLRDVWRYRPGPGWERRADLPKPVVAAPTPAPVSGSKVYIFGGDDGSLVGYQPVAKHPGFSRSVLTYDARADVWAVTGEVPAPRAVLPTAFWQDRWVLPNGEARPGVRSPQVWSFKPAL